MQVTNYSNTLLPLARPGEEISETIYAASFVVSFQNRWDSFSDPNRWLIRFRDTFETMMGPALGGADLQVHDLFPGYWHTSDYMQHRIIGPVVVQVYESDVIEPGIYAVTPSVTEWEAPGYIIPDDRALIASGEIRRKVRGDDIPTPIRDSFFYDMPRKPKATERGQKYEAAQVHETRTGERVDSGLRASPAAA